MKEKINLSINPDQLKELSDDEFKKLTANAVTLSQEDTKENQLIYYKPASPEILTVHRSNAQTIGIFGGNGSGKSETMLLEMIICATGIIPQSLKGSFDRSKLRGPINCRLVVQSLTTTLHTVILPKLMWSSWTGVDMPGGERGHWGWIPRYLLIGGSWEKSWSEKLRLLRFNYADPENPDIVGESSIQFMSTDQDPEDFKSGDFEFIGHDEIPKNSQWRENEARTMRVNGRMMLAMTWPDDASIAVDWIMDRILDLGSPGPNKDPTIDCFNLHTPDNKYLDQKAVSEQAKKWTKEMRDVRLYGQSLRFSNLIHPLFTDQTKNWCFPCGKSIILVDGKCSCGSKDTVEYNHVQHEDVSHKLPTMFGLDPHPRKPHMFAWYQITPYDDIIQVFEGKLDGDPVDLKKFIDEVESDLDLWVVRRFMDPNMGASPSGATRGVTWRDEFDNAGLYMDFADCSDVGRGRINEYLRPDASTRIPRIRIRPQCTDTIYQFKRYVWDEYRQMFEKDLKQKAKQKNDDFPTLMKYLLNMNPSFSDLIMGQPVISRFKKKETDDTWRRR